MLMHFLYLSRADVESLNVTMRQVLDAVDEGFRLKGLGKCEMPPKIGIHTVPDAFIHAMPAFVGGDVQSAGLKWVSGYPSNIAKKLPYITGLLILNDPQTGILIAVMDCSWITAMRTGASVGISARYLGDASYQVAGILGCGVQARTSLMAMVETLPNLSQVRCNDLFPAATVRFIDEMAKRFPQLKFIPCDRPADVAQDADIIVTAIPIVTQPQPPLDAGLLKPGALAVSLDYDSAWTSAAMKQCDVFCCDDTEQLLYTKNHGVYFAGIPDNIHGDLGELACGKIEGRTRKQDRIFSMNMGIAIDDMVTAKVLYDRAVQRGVGMRLPL